MISRAATYRELAGSPKIARRLSTLGRYAEPVVRAAITELHAKGENSNSTNVVKHIKGEETQKHREESRAEWRPGDCREVMEDGIEDDTAAALITGLPGPSWAARCSSSSGRAGSHPSRYYPAQNV